MIVPTIADEAKQHVVMKTTLAKRMSASERIYIPLQANSSPNNRNSIDASESNDSLNLKLLHEERLSHSTNHDNSWIDQHVVFKSLTLLYAFVYGCFRAYPLQLLIRGVETHTSAKSEKKSKKIRDYHDRILTVYEFGKRQQQQQQQQLSSKLETNDPYEVQHNLIATIISLLSAPHIPFVEKRAIVHFIHEHQWLDSLNHESRTVLHDTMSACLYQELKRIDRYLDDTYYQLYHSNEEPTVVMDDSDEEVNTKSPKPEEEVTISLNKIIIDKEKESKRWVKLCEKLLEFSNQKSIRCAILTQENEMALNRCDFKGKTKYHPINVKAYKETCERHKIDICAEESIYTNLNKVYLHYLWSLSNTHIHKTLETRLQSQMQEYKIPFDEVWTLPVRELGTAGDMFEYMTTRYSGYANHLYNGNNVNNQNPNGVQTNTNEEYLETGFMLDMCRAYIVLPDTAAVVKCVKMIDKQFHICGLENHIHHYYSTDLLNTYPQRQTSQNSHPVDSNDKNIKFSRKSKVKHIKQLLAEVKTDQKKKKNQNTGPNNSNIDGHESESKNNRTDGIHIDKQGYRINNVMNILHPNMTGNLRYISIYVVVDSSIEEKLDNNEKKEDGNINEAKKSSISGRNNRMICELRLVLTPMWKAHRRYVRIIKTFGKVLNPDKLYQCVQTFEEETRPEVHDPHFKWFWKEEIESWKFS